MFISSLVTIFATSLKNTCFLKKCIRILASVLSDSYSSILYSPAKGLGICWHKFIFSDSWFSHLGSVAYGLFLNTTAVLCIVVVLFLNYLSLFGAEWSSMFFHHCSLEPMCLSSAWLTDLVHVKSHWPILGRLQGSVGTGHNLGYTVRAFRLLDYDFVLAAVTKIEVMLCSSLKLLRSRDYTRLIFLMTII